MATVREVDPDRLLGTLRALSPAATLAIVDAAERLWVRIERRGRADLDVLLGEAGLLWKPSVLITDLNAGNRPPRPRESPTVQSN